jgi:hypothetical protein
VTPVKRWQRQTNASVFDAQSVEKEVGSLARHLSSARLYAKNYGGGGRRRKFAAVQVSVYLLGGAAVFLLAGRRLTHVGWHYWLLPVHYPKHQFQYVMRIAFHASRHVAVTNRVV